MKKLVLLALLALATTAYAQDRTTGLESRNTGFGIKGGFNLSDLLGSGTDVFANKDLLGTFHAGVYAQHGFTNFFSIQGELLYSRKGFRADSMGMKSHQSTRLDYIELPVLLVGNITETLSLHLGPQVSVLTGGRNGGYTLNLDQSGYRRFDFGGILGAQARLGYARVGIRYDLSFAKLYKDGAHLTYNGQPLKALVTDENIRNQVLQVYLGIGFAH